MAGAQKGASLEELVRTYFARQGFYALRGVSFRFEDEEVTDVDVWLYGRQAASVRTRTIVDVKDKRSPKAFERILWTRGMQLALGADRAVVATTETSVKVTRFAQQQKVALLSKSFLERLSKGLVAPERLSNEEFYTPLQKNASHKQDGDWIKRLENAKSAIVSLSGYPAFNRAMSSFRFFGERVQTRTFHREQALRCMLMCGSLACIALDAALERSVYEEAPQRYDAIRSGVTYGDSGDARVQNSIDTIVSIISAGMDNGKVVSRQVESALESMFRQVRSDIIAEYFVREHNAAVLFGVAKELDDKAYAADATKILELSKEAKSILGVFADFSEIKRSFLVESESISMISEVNADNVKNIDKKVDEGEKDAQQKNGNAKLL